MTILASLDAMFQAGCEFRENCDIAEKTQYGLPDKKLRRNVELCYPIRASHEAQPSCATLTSCKQLLRDTLHSAALTSSSIACRLEQLPAHSNLHCPLQGAQYLSMLVTKRW
jgi:hypothetical protein